MREKLKKRWQLLRAHAHDQRERIRPYPHLNSAYRAAVAFVGTVMVLGGAAMVPLPTPGFGWILIFLGLGVLSTEFVWAQKLTTWLRRALDWAAAWWKRRSPTEKSGLIFALSVLILLILWLSGMLGTAGSWVGVDRQWLHGPIRRH
ncbi:hypothetical protein GOHSU_18_01310 [Gordonia hirsuta DSM 44140 = NBRC 16056]|uniref:TIGR02611 family protein n=1 Tax=Gordonia hirsuta DSM 44140 = NBRC 16056 TaxID=1121927 RepID=L7L9E5_9ACTN|nr:TIGR02611 family protein [Gordonia hirsuta]GAC57376.1 hypothetical protein GOHSU_18_01310 [Gordonia hirsuta DSM 44140 = NBRC 16056]